MTDKQQSKGSDVERLVELLQKTKLDYSIELPEPPAVIKVNDAIFSTMGNFSLVLGKAKSKKTFCVTLSMAAAVGNMRTPMFTGSLPKNKDMVLYFDTEQERYQVIKAAKRVCKLSEVEEPKNFKVYSLRGINTKDRRRLIEFAISKEKKAGFVVIDGIRDLVSSINSEEEATEISDWLLRITQEYQLHILTVLHQNKTDNKARGHLGTELTNKAETTAVVQKKNEGSYISVVKPEYCRHVDFEPFSFYVNEDGLPEHYDDQVPLQAAIRSKSPDSIGSDQLKRLINNSFEETPGKLNYSSLREKIKKAAEIVLKNSIGEKKAGEYLKKALETGLVIQDGKRGTKASYYTLNGKK